MALSQQQAGSFGGHGRVRGSDRVSLRVRIPRDVKAAVDAAAAESGLPITDYVALTLARRLNLPDPDYISIPAPSDQDELELGLPDRREGRLSA